MKTYLKITFLSIAVFNLSACSNSTSSKLKTTGENKPITRTGAKNKHNQDYAMFVSDRIINWYTNAIESTVKNMNLVHKKSPSPNPKETEISSTTLPPLPSRQDVIGSFKWHENDTKIIDFEEMYSGPGETFGKEITWKITTNDSHNGEVTHTFVGNVTKITENKEIEEITVAISDTGLESTLACLLVNCLDAFALVKQDGKIVADIFRIRNIRRVKIEIDEEATLALAEQSNGLKNTYVHNTLINFDTKVIQTRPGFTKITLKHSNLIDIHGELVHSEGRCSPLYFTDPTSPNSTGTYCVEENDHQTQLILNYNFQFKGRNYKVRLLMQERDSGYINPPEESPETVSSKTKTSK